MGKEGDLWDDSALINAFDHAISTYKKMHKNKNNSKDESAEAEAEAEGETVMGATAEENGSNGDFRNLDTARDVDEKSNIPATGTPDLGETGSVPKLGDDRHAESQVGHTCQDSTRDQGIQSEHDAYAYAYAQGVEEYNQLVAQYNELEEKRLKIWEQLNQYSAWNYQYDATATSSGVPYSNVQDYSMSPYQVSDPNVVCTCCPCFSQCSMASCTSAPAPGCSLDESGVGKPCNSHYVEMDHKVPFPCEDGKIHKIAMGAAESALSSIRTTISGDSNVNEEKERTISEPKQTSGSGTDLTALLNAWYSAGFYTGKYLAEQSMANRK